MKRLALSFAAVLALSVVMPPVAGAFGLQDFKMTFSDQAGSGASQAGAHPFAFTTSFEVETIEENGNFFAAEAVRELELDAPPGLVAVPGAVPTCSMAAFLTFKNGFGSECPDNTAVGKTAVEVGEAGIKAAGEPPVFNLDPPPGKVAKLGFRFLNVPVTIDLGLSEDPPYNGIATARNISQVLEFFASETTLWGLPASSAHDAERGNCLARTEVEDLCPAKLEEVPFIISPRACQGPLPIGWTIDTWAKPGEWLSGSARTEEFTGCGRLGLAAGISARPTSRAAESPTGLDFGLDVQDEGLLSPKQGATAGSDIRKAVVTLPEGMTINPSQAEGLEVCSEAQLARERSDSAPGEGCPEASKIGTIEVETPLLKDEVLKGSLFVAKPYENEFHTLIAFYIVIKDPELGILVTQAAKVEPDPRTGQLVTTTENMPQLPFSHFRLHFREGGRSPLISPPGCGKFTVEAELFPWSGGPPTPASSTFEVISGPNGAPCPPPGSLPFRPGFTAGSVNNAAGSYSPVAMRLTRRDGDQDLTRFSATLPAGLLAKLAGTTRCPDANIATAKAKSGLAERAAPSCPLSSQIGHVLAGAGVGSQLTYVPGTIYLAGPFGGAPLSVVAIVPAVAGPFDVGTVVTREALRVHPRTGVASVDGLASDPIPHILAGIPLKVRDIRVHVDRPGFTLNPTSCEPMGFLATLWGGGNNVFSVFDDSPLAVPERFQAASCGALGFKPRLKLKLKGGTRRGKFPSFRAVYRPRPGDANLRGLILRLPRSEFIEQGHFRTICTRVQDAADRCPRGATYGHVRAFTPLLSEPLEGPAFLRSSNHDLPDLVFDLHGIVDVEAVTRIDSAGGGLRATVEEAPDAPLTKVVVRMQGGKKGLIVNSTNICRRKHRANARYSAHNGMRAKGRPLMRAQCGKKRKHGRHRRR